MTFKEMNLFVKNLNYTESVNFETVSDEDFLRMVTCQRAVILDQKCKEDEEKLREEMMTVEERIEQEARSYATSIFDEINNVNKNVYDEFEDVMEINENSCTDGNIEVVVVEPVNMLNNDYDNCSADSITSTTGIVPVSIKDSVLTGFSIFGDASRFENTMDCSNKTVVDCVIAYVKCKFTSQGKSKKAGKGFRSLLKYLKQIEIEYSITLMPPVIRPLFMNRFEDYLLEKNLSPSTVAGMIDQLKCVMRWAGSYGARIPADLDNFKVKLTDAKPKIALSEDDLQRIYWFDINSLPVRPQLKKTYMKVRDHFILSCFIGQRYSDTIRVDKKISMETPWKNFPFGS